MDYLGALAPQRWAERLLELRFDVNSRPKWLEPVSVASGVLKEPAMSELPGVSIVIGNYNYAQFVGAAIDSALAQDHSRCEVIVVDDGSTDGSQEVIERYRDRARVILLPTNRGQVAALNEAWPTAKYEIVIFLDSDDLLEPHAASTIARNWRADVVKVQFPMKSIDAMASGLITHTPKYPPDLRTDTLRHTLLRFGGLLFLLLGAATPMRDVCWRSFLRFPVCHGWTGYWDPCTILWRGSHPHDPACILSDP